MRKRLKFRDRVLTRWGLKVWDSLALRFWPRLEVCEVMSGNVLTDWLLDLLK